MWKVMIADDEPYIREGLEKLIDWESLGCELIYSAENGQRLLEGIKRERPDLVIADIRMPLMSGLEVAQYICEHHMDIEVIILTAFADFQYAKEAIRCQVSDYIVKTSALEDIPAAIEKIKSKLEAKKLSVYRMMLAPGAGGAKSHSRFMLSAFEGYDFRVAGAGEDELCMVFSLRASDDSESLTRAGEKFSALCKSFLGVTAPVIFSAPYEDARMEYSVYEELLRFWRERSREIEEGTCLLLEKARREAESGTDGESWMDREGRTVRGRWEGGESWADEENGAAGGNGTGRGSRPYRGSREDGESWAAGGNGADEGSQPAGEIWPARESRPAGGTGLGRESGGWGGEEDLASRIVSYIRVNYTKKITLDEIAEAVHVNRSYLSRFYKERTGRNLFDEINDMRMEKAKAYIKEGRYKIYEIAGMTGFDDNAYFSRVFKKYTGMSPREYETACRGRTERED